jgi:hypothetical protein
MSSFMRVEMGIASTLHVSIRDPPRQFEAAGRFGTETRRPAALAARGRMGGNDGTGGGEAKTAGGHPSYPHFDEARRADEPKA